VILELLAGVALALLTLRDVFETVVVPGESRGMLRIARRIVFATLPLWRGARARGGGISTSFAPFALVASFVVWMSLLTLAFGLMAHGLRDDFQPALSSFPQALYVAGSGLVTVGLSGTDAMGAARWVVLIAGFCGLAVMTMAVTYLLEVQGGIAARDAGILKMTTSAGHPPSGLALLERYAELGLETEVGRILRDSREWCAVVLQSHAAHPTLIYFRSKRTGAGWPGALGAIMDVALSIDVLMAAPQWRGQANLLLEEGERLALALTELLGLDCQPEPPDEAEVDEFISRLAAAGYPLKVNVDRGAFIAERARRTAAIVRMAHHLGTPTAALIPLSGESDAIAR
jgi:hypothetical protein